MKSPKRRSAAREVGAGRRSEFFKKMLMMMAISRMVGRARSKSNNIHKMRFQVENSRAKLRVWQLSCVNAFWSSSEGPKTRRDLCLLLSSD